MKRVTVRRSTLGRDTPRYSLTILSGVVTEADGRVEQAVVSLDADELRTLQREITAEITLLATETRQA